MDLQLLLRSFLWPRSTRLGEFIFYNIFSIATWFGICCVEEGLSGLFPSDVDIPWALAVTAIPLVGIWALVFLFLMVIILVESVLAPIAS